MRTRSKSSPTQSGTGSTVNLITMKKIKDVPWSFSQRIESMEDNPHGLSTVNACLHTVSEVLGGSSSFVIRDGSSLILEDGWVDKVSPRDAWFSLNPTFSTSTGQFIARAISEIKPKLSSDVSVPNFLYELREIKSLASAIKSGVGLVRGKRNRRGRKTDVLDVASDVHLSTSFGFNPLISDTFQLATLMQDFAIKYRNFTGHAGKPVRGYYAENGSMGSITRVLPSNAVWDLRLVETGLSAKRTLVIYYTYRIIGGYNPTPTISDLLRYVGFRSSAAPQIVWNALPYSFIVDWVFKVSDALGRFDAGSLPVRMDISRGCLSVKTTQLTSLTRVGRGGRVISPNSVVYKQTRYTRTPISKHSLEMFGAVTPLPSVDGLSLREISLALALGNKMR